MNKNSTPLLSYCDFENFTTDLVSDAFGIDATLLSLLRAPDDIIQDPSEEVLNSLFEKINHDTKVLWEEGWKVEKLIGW